MRINLGLIREKFGAARRLAGFMVYLFVCIEYCFIYIMTVLFVRILHMINIKSSVGRIK